MVGDRFTRYLKPVPPRHLTRLNLFLNFLDYRITDAQKRASHITPTTYGIRLLTEIIKLSDLDTLFSFNQADEQVQYLLSILKDLEKPVDPRNGRHTTKSLFIKSKSFCYELIAPSRRDNPLGEIPYDKPYDDVSWQAIRPLRVIDMGTCDLHTSVHSGYLHYPRRGPTHAVYTIDCFALVTKFIAYYKTQDPSLGVDQILLDFLHNDVIIPALLQDTLAIWLRNSYKQQFMVGSPLEFHTSTVWDVVTTDVIGTDFNGAMGDILHLKQDLEKHTQTPQTILSSLLVTTEQQSLSAYINDLHTTTQSPDLRPFIWVDCLKYLAWWEMVLVVTSFHPDLPQVISLRRDILRDVRLFVMMKPWQEIYHSYPFKTMVRAKLEGLYTYLNTHP